MLKSARFVAPGSLAVPQHLDQRHARRGLHLTESTLPALLGFRLHGAHLLAQLLGLEELLRLLPAVVGAARHPVRDHGLHLAHRAGLFARERGREVELRHRGFALAHGVLALFGDEVHAC